MRVVGRHRTDGALLVKGTHSGMVRVLEDGRLSREVSIVSLVARDPDWELGSSREDRALTRKQPPSVNPQQAYQSVSDSHARVEDVWRNKDELGLDPETAFRVGRAHEDLENVLDAPGFRALVRKEDDSGRLYAVHSMKSQGDEDEGNYSEPDERPLYQRAGAWPDELWTSTDPRDIGKQAQKDISDSERYYLNKASDGDCDDCAFFRGAGRPCAVVRAPISPEGVCDYWSAEEKPHPSGLSPEDANYRSPADQQDSDSERYYLNKVQLPDNGTIRKSEAGLALVAIGCVVQDGKVLLGRKPDDDQSDMAGQWVLPGGHVEDGEDIAAACVREMVEETGLPVVVTRELLSEVKGSNELHFFLCTPSQGEDAEIPGMDGTPPHDSNELSDVDFYAVRDGEIEGPFNETETLDELNQRVVEAALRGPRETKAINLAFLEPLLKAPGIDTHMGSDVRAAGRRSARGGWNGGIDPRNLRMQNVQHDHGDPIGSHSHGVLTGDTHQHATYERPAGSTPTGRRRRIARKPIGQPYTHPMSLPENPA